MEVVKKVRLFLGCNIISCFAVIIVLLEARKSKLAVLGFLIVESVLAVYLIWGVIKSLKRLNITLKQCTEQEIDSEKKLDDISENIIFLDEIRSLVHACTMQKARESSAEMFDKQAKLTALQSQINPHFLYNTLESIRGQALMDDNCEIAKMVEALASFFRYSISRKGNLVTLRDELANIKNYMMIQQYRFNNRFSLDIIIDEEDEPAYDYRIPKLIIQPVIENAIFHGLEERVEEGLVTIEIVVTEETLIITISDNGKGMDSKTLQDLNQRIHLVSSYLKEKEEDSRNTGIALTNIHKRIQLLFGNEFGLNVYSTLNQGTDVEITIPSNYERNVDET